LKRKGIEGIEGIEAAHTKPQRTQSRDQSGSHQAAKNTKQGWKRLTPSRKEHKGIDSSLCLRVFV
jgi:hypothetical protein